MTDRAGLKKRWDKVSRRLFFKLGLIGFVSALAASMGGFVRFFFPKILFEPAMSLNAGFPEDYPLGEVSARHREEHGIWIVHASEGIYALVSSCTHLGCQTYWIQEESLFKCPCHGTNFDVEGDVVAGPAPEPLFRASIKLNSLGQVIINKALTENKTDDRNKAPFVLVA